MIISVCWPKIKCNTTSILSCYSLFFSGSIFYINENGNVTAVMECQNEIKSMLHHEKKELLIVILDDVSVNQYATSLDGKIQHISKVISIFFFSLYSYH